MVTGNVEGAHSGTGKSFQRAKHSQITGRDHAPVFKIEIKKIAQDYHHIGAARHAVQKSADQFCPVFGLRVVATAQVRVAEKHHAFIRRYRDNCMGRRLQVILSGLWFCFSVV